MAGRLLTPLGLFALALAIRLLPWPTVLESDRVVFFGMDAWYHVRRIQMALANGGWPPAFDPYLNFPHGAFPIWPPFFDAFAAAWVAPAQALWGWAAAERSAALLPPVLGALCVVVLYRLAVGLFDRVVALLAAGVLSLLSAHFWYSQIGFLDHHAAVALVTTGLLAAGIRLLERIVEPGARATGRAAGTGALAGGCLLVWPGTLLHVGILVATVGIAWLTRPSREEARRGALALALCAAAAFAVTEAASWTSPWRGPLAFRPTLLSSFQPWLFASLGLCAGACAWLWRPGAAGHTLAGRRLQAVGVGALVTLGSFVLFPDLAAGLGEAWRWFAKDEVFQGLVKESKPLLVGEAGFDPHNAELRLSRWLYATPVALAALARHARRSEHPGAWLVFAWVAVLAAATLLQRRFFNSLSPAYALLMAWALVSLLRALPGRVAGAPGWGVPARIAVVVIAVWLFVPTLAAYRLPAGNLVKRARGEAMTVPKNEISRRVLLEAATWLASSTPPTAAPLDPTARPAYGVLAPWGFGHLIKYVAKRPTVVGNFGDDVGEANLRRVDAYFASREPDAVRILDDLRARYVLLATLGEVDGERLRGEAMRKRLSVDDSPGLAHHRLVYESPLDERWSRIGRSELRIFERVEGARLVGRAPPGEPVVARLEYTSNRGRRGRFETGATAGSDGRYELRLPYATRGAPPALEPDPAYRVACGGRVASVVVQESAVRSGATLAGPDLRRDPLAGRGTLPPIDP